MLFDFEALDADEGDCLLLHYGAAEDPRHAVIDGGLARTWVNRLRPRLEQLRERHELDDETSLALDLVVVTHIDRDHIEGIVTMFEELAEGTETPPWTIDCLWHNGFDNSLGTNQIAAIRKHAGGAQGVADGLALRSLAKRRVRSINGPKEQLPARFVLRGAGAVPSIPFDGGLTLTVLAPTVDELHRLQTVWDAYLQQHPDEEAGGAAATKRTVTPENLSSIALLAKVGHRTVLLAGDTGHQQLLDGLTAAEVLGEGERCELDVMKVSHHGSCNNASLELFDRVHAKHYVFCANGKHSNPDIETLELLWKARGKEADKWQIWTTFTRNAFEDVEDTGPEASKRREALEEIQRWFNRHKVKVNHRDPDALGIVIALGTETLRPPKGRS